MPRLKFSKRLLVITVAAIAIAILFTIERRTILDTRQVVSPNGEFTFSLEIREHNKLLSSRYEVDAEIHRSSDGQILRGSYFDLGSNRSTPDLIDLTTNVSKRPTWTNDSTTVNFWVTDFDQHEMFVIKRSDGYQVGHNRIPN